MLGRHEVSVLAVPVVVLSGKVLAGDELGVEHCLLRAVLAVGDVDGLEEIVHELLVFVVGRNLESEELRGIGQAVHADGKILALHVDETGAVYVEHLGLQEVLDNLVEGDLILVHTLRLGGDCLADALVEGILVVTALLQRLAGFEVHALLLLEVSAGGILDKTVQVDGHDRLGAGGDGSRTHGVLVGGVVVLGILGIEVFQRVAQAAAAGKAVRTVGEIAEEAVPLAPHLGCEVGVILVGEIVAPVGQQGHGLHRECEDVLVALLVEPVHEVLLEPVQGLPLGRSAVGEAEVAEDALEIGLVEIADIPEHGLVAAVSGRHVHGMDHLLEAVVDHLGKRALLDIVLNDLVEALQIVVAIVLADEVVQIDEELRSSHGAHELGGYGVHQIDELAAETLEVGGSDGNTAEFAETAHQERIHGDGHAVRIAGGAAFVVLVEHVGLQVLDILLGKGGTVEVLDLVLHDVAVLLDIVLLVEFLAERHDVLAGDVGVCIELGAGGGVGGLDIVLDEVPLLAEVLAVVELLDILQGGFLVDGHQGIYHLPADLLTRHVVIDIKVVGNGNNDLFRAALARRFVGLANTFLQFLEIELFNGSICFPDVHKINRL